MPQLQQPPKTNSLTSRGKSFDNSFCIRGENPTMKYYRFNQIAMAVLGALLLIFGTRTLMQIAFEEHAPEKPGMEVAGTKHGEEPGAETPAAGASQLPALLAKGDAAKGDTAAAVCKVCHSFDAGAPSPIGPNLHSVVGRKIASVEGFNYSPALKAKSGEDWTYDNLEHFIHKPAEYAPGTLMAFPGIPDEQQVADVILFLRTKTDNPPPLPEVTAVPAPEAAPAGEAAKPAADPNVEVAALVAKADPAKGESAAAMCKVCHAVEKGAPSPVGPNLYGVIGRPIASVEGFNYSPALKAKASEGDWDYAHIDAFIHKPMEYAPGTMMAFPGIPDANQRAEVLAWLRTKADSPAPLPEAAAATPEAPKEEAPADAAPAPAAEEEKPAEAPPAPSAADKPAETPAAPEAKEKPAEAAPAPMEEEKPAEAAPMEEKPAEAAPAPSPAADADYSTPSTTNQPQPAAPDAGNAGAAESPSPAAEEKPAEAAPSSQPQPVYPDGPPQ
jgi:cytochrome c